MATASSDRVAYPQLVEALVDQNQFVIHYDLDGVVRAAERLGLGRPARRVVLVAGTNGKGTTCAHINAYAQSAGLRVGLYTSPHLLDVRERIRVHSKPIDEAGFLGSVLPVFRRFSRESDDSRALSYFEILTLGAWSHFARSDLDLAIFEVGLGGRLDATNAIEPDVTIITGVALDHRDYLGETIAEIAAEKAGVMRAGRPVVVHPMAGGFGEILAEAQSRGARPIIETEGTEAIAWNRALAWSGFRELFPGEASRSGRKVADRNVRWPGRRQRIETDKGPLFLDGAHNAQALRATAEWLGNEVDGGVDLIFGLSGSRSASELLPLIAPVANRVIATPCAGAPSVPTQDILEAAVELELPATEVESIAEALDGPGHRPRAVIGSLYLVGDALRELGYSVDDLAIYFDSNRSESSR